MNAAIGARRGGPSTSRGRLSYRNSPGTAITTMSLQRPRLLLNGSQVAIRSALLSVVTPYRGVVGRSRVRIALFSEGGEGLKLGTITRTAGVLWLGLSRLFCLLGGHELIGEGRRAELAGVHSKRAAQVEHLHDLLCRGTLG
jgi:hypothetical protein